MTVTSWVNYYLTIAGKFSSKDETFPAFLHHFHGCFEKSRKLSRNFRFGADPKYRIPRLLYILFWRPINCSFWSVHCFSMKSFCCLVRPWNINGQNGMLGVIFTHFRLRVQCSFSWGSQRSLSMAKLGLDGINVTEAILVIALKLVTIFDARS